MKYRLIACDMDETLLNDDHQIPQANIDAIKRAKEHGVLFVPSTGRGYLSLQHDLETLGLLDQPGQYVLSYNGGVLTENKDNRMLFFRGMSFEKIKELFEFGLKQDVCIHIYTQKELFTFNLSDSEKERIVRQKVAHTHVTDNQIDFLRETPIAKILYQNMDVPYLKSLEPLMEAILSDVQVSYSSNRYMEFNAAGVNKGQGLLDLAEYLGIAIEETIAVGDNSNDLPMLQVAGLSVAAGNAIPEVKERCDYTTTATNNEGVIAELVAKFIDVY